MTNDILDRLAVYAPTSTSVAPEWGPVEQEHHLAAVLAAGRAPERRMRFVPRTHALRGRAIAPIAASVAVLVVAATAAVLVGHGSGGPTGSGPAGDGVSSPAAPTTASFRATVSTPRLGAHQWAYRAVSAYDISPNSDSRADRSAVWVTRDGSGQQYGFDGSTATCQAVHAVRHTSFDDPTQKFVDTLPTDPVALKTFLTERVQGSTSQEEAIFVAVGDLLRTGDLLASSAQRAAMVTVLAGLGRTTVHADTDERGRSAVRVDFVDPNQRGGEIQSLYFDRRTFQLLEERTGNGPEVASAGPSAPYTSTPTDAPASTYALPAKSSVVVLTAERVENALPSNCGLPVAPGLATSSR